jgi:hypothetical protein
MHNWYAGMPVTSEETVYGDWRKDFATRGRANAKRETPEPTP